MEINREEFMRLLNTAINQKIKKVTIYNCGKVYQVNSNNHLDIYLNGSTEVTPNIPCNPDVTFNINDEVEVIARNGNMRDLFIPYKRSL